ncbi:MAG: cytochrome c maturation protein CcmE [Spirochaetales bacterium]|nr:cytochrome c maturation protein CcmE [Spirochaetales bacterium]
MNLKVVIAVALVGAGLASMVFLGGSQSPARVMILDVAAVVQSPEQFRDRELRVRGFIKPGSILRSGEQADFILSQDRHELKVRFDGSTQLPDTFTDGVPARADGYIQADGTFVASKLEAKCTSKYDGTPNSGHPGELKNPYEI